MGDIDVLRRVYGQLTLTDIVKARERELKDETYKALANSGLYSWVDIPLLYPDTDDDDETGCSDYSNDVPSSSDSSETPSVKNRVRRILRLLSWRV
ncbi:MAG: hypothetical protein Q4P66_03330 [Actinomycetaceae bacterium]|nr:hypothetical protein [Actinomycetaceae bacterium]